MNYEQLTEEERYHIYGLIKAGMNQAQIAKALNRSPSTISRELRRNRGLKGYRPQQAHHLCRQRRHTAVKAYKLTPELIQRIQQLLLQDLSPEQIAGYLVKHTAMKVSHETIYRYLYEDKAQGGCWYKRLRLVPKGYRKRYGSYQKRGQIVGRVSIEKRPAIVDQRGRLGDWEGDTIIGKGRKSALLTLVERKSLYTVIVKLSGKQATPLAERLIAGMDRYQDQFKTVTFDNGLEFADHARITKALGVKVYFAHPYASWERGINENTNGLIRQYFPKGMDLSTVTDEQIQQVMNRLNHRPRKTRGFKTPHELFKGQPSDLLAA